MKTSYSVLWQEADGAVIAGRLDVRPRGVHFAPSGDGGSSEELHYEDLAALRIALKPEEQLEGKPTVVAERLAASPVRIASVAKSSLASELARGLEAVALGGDLVPARLLVIVPLKEGAEAEARRLLRTGPPFAPEQMGLDRHEAFLTANEAVFLFESFDGEASLRRLMADASVWTAAPAWRELIARPPRVAETVYAWEHRLTEGETSATSGEL